VLSEKISGIPPEKPPVLRLKKPPVFHLKDLLPGMDPDITIPGSSAS
jgi:hypothetical protein